VACAANIGGMTDNRRVLVVQGHPDPAGGRLCHALADTYAQSALAAGHEVRRIEVARLDFPLLRTAADWNQGQAPASLVEAQDGIRWANHMLLLFPLWMGDMPAVLKGFLEQVLRPGFAFDRSKGGPLGQKALGGRSARVVVTMGMPALAYRYVFRAHSVKSLERNILGFTGISPVHETLIGSVESASPAMRSRWFTTLQRLGAEGE
jgi:putative NADPH-quinone reductase